MNRITLGAILHQFSLIGISLLVCIFQTFAWPQVMGLHVTPQLWVIILLYFRLQKSLLRALIYLLLHGYIFSYFTAQPLGYIWLAGLLVVSTVSFFKDRFFGPGKFYSFSGVAFGLLLWNIFSVIISMMFERRFIYPQLINRFFDIFISVPFSGLIFSVLNFFEQPDDKPSVLASVVHSKGEE